MPAKKNCCKKSKVATILRSRYWYFLTQNLHCPSDKLVLPIDHFYIRRSIVLALRFVDIIDIDLPEKQSGKKIKAETVWISSSCSNSCSDQRIMHAKIKVLLASRPKMLSDVVRNIITRQPDMEVVGEVLDPIELFFAARVAKVDVVIVTPLDPEEEPPICRHLLAEHPRLKVVTLSVQGEIAFLYESGAGKKRIDEPCKQSILDAIREPRPPITD